MRGALLKLAGLAPQSVKHWLYRHPRLLGAAARLLKAAATDEPTVVTIPAGPLAGMKLAVDRDTPNFYWLTDAYEKELLPFIEQCCVPGTTVADVGAHIGYDTLLMARRVGPAGSVLSFEPDPQNRARLQRNVAINELANVRIFAEAISDRVGQVAFAAEGTTTSRVVDGGEAASGEVAATTLDALKVEPRFVKIDVEGHEAAVLRGAAWLLQEVRPMLLIEVHSPASLRDCAGLLRDGGYALDPIGPQADAVAAVLAGRDARVDRGYLAARPTSC